MKTRTISLLLPYNEEGKILIQDRRGYKNPPWGYFGGGVENEETAVEAVIREVEEELELLLSKSDLDYLGEFEDNIRGIRYVYLWRVDDRMKKVKLHEGNGMRFVNLEEGRELITGEMAKKIFQAAHHTIINKQ